MITAVNAQVLFSGFLQEARLRGEIVRSRYSPGDVTLDEPVPRFTLGPDCNHLGGANPDGTYLISFGCGLLRAAWRFTAAVAAPVSSAWPYEVDLTGLARTTGPAPSYSEDWFAPGWAQWTPSGGTPQRRAILRSTNPSSGALTITLHRWWDGNPAPGDTIVLFPGCDGRRETCQTQFANDLNFGGHDAMPAGNPSLLKLTNRATGGGKK